MAKHGGQPKPETIPTFASEDEERRFWDEHDPSLYFTEPAEVIVRLKSAKKKMVSVRIDEALYDQLKAVAAEHGLPYQRLMRELLRQALGTLAQKEGRKAKI
jgi:predicted DNA binding CopG/RHH family protein